MNDEAKELPGIISEDFNGIVKSLRNAVTTTKQTQVAGQKDIVIIAFAPQDIPRADRVLRVLADTITRMIAKNPYEGN